MLAHTLEWIGVHRQPAQVLVELVPEEAAGDSASGPASANRRHPRVRTRAAAMAMARRLAPMRRRALSQYKQ